MIICNNIKKKKEIKLQEEFNSKVAIIITFYNK